MVFRQNASTILHLTGDTEDDTQDLLIGKLAKIICDFHTGDAQYHVNSMPSFVSPRSISAAKNASKEYKNTDPAFDDVIGEILGTLSTDDGDGNGDVGTERKDWGENAVVARILNIKHLPNLQR